MTLYRTPYDWTPPEDTGLINAFQGPEQPALCAQEIPAEGTE